MYAQRLTIVRCQPPRSEQLVRQRPLGRTGIDVSVLGLGTVKLGRNRGVRYPSHFDLPDDDAVRNLLHAAMDVGINLIDTAPAYGTSEERLGALLHRRDDWIIVTKAGESFDGASSTFDFRPEAIHASVDRSLARLRTDVIDVLLIHSDGSDVEIIERDGVLDVMDELKAAGKIRATGMSTKTVGGARLAIPRVDVLMLALNRADDSQLPAIRESLHHGVGVLIKKALESGHAAEVPSTDPVRDALNYVYDAARVTSIVVGTLNADHLRANAAIADELTRDQTVE